jgi:hypothetical protein
MLQNTAVSFAAVHTIQNSENARCLLCGAPLSGALPLALPASRLEAHGMQNI